MARTGLEPQPAPRYVNRRRGPQTPGNFKTACRPSSAHHAPARGGAMTGPQPPPIPPAALLATFGTAAAPLMVDVRRGPAFDADDTLIAGALRRLPEETGAWARVLPAGRPVVAYCVHGHEV